MGTDFDQNGFGGRRRTWRHQRLSDGRETPMTKIRHLICTAIAAAGLMISASNSFAQQPDVGDQPGLVADDSYELDPEWQKKKVFFPTPDPPGPPLLPTPQRRS